MTIYAGTGIIQRLIFFKVDHEFYIYTCTRANTTPFKVNTCIYIVISRNQMQSGKHFIHVLVKQYNDLIHTCRSNYFKHTLGLIRLKKSTFEFLNQ